MPQMLYFLDADLKELCLVLTVDAAKKSSVAVAAIVGPIAAAVVIIPIGLFLLFRSWKHKRTSSADPFDAEKPGEIWI